MISRRSTIKLAAAGIAAASLRRTGAAPVSAQEAADSAIATWGGNLARTGETSGEGPSTELPIVRKWKVGDVGSGRYQSQPVIVDGVAYVATPFSLRAFRIDSGADVWSFFVQSIYQNGGNLELYTPTVADGVVYATCMNGRLYAVDALTGAELWRTDDFDSAEGAIPAVVDGLVLCASTKRMSAEHFEGAAFAFAAETGEVVWETKFGDSGPMRSAAVADGVAFFGAFDTLHALRVDTGEKLWEFVGGDQLQPPAVADGVVFLKTGTRLYALDAATGEEIWRLTDLGYSIAPPSVSEGALFVAGEERLYSLGTASGSVNWWVPGEGFERKPVIAADTVYFSGRGLLALRKSNGVPLWSFDWAGEGSPELAGGNLYMCGDGCNLTMLGNMVPITLARDVVLRVSPSDRGLESGQAAAGTVVDLLGARETRGGETWVEATIGELTGWIPLAAIDPATLPPEGEIEYASIFDA